MTTTSSSRASDDVLARTLREESGRLVTAMYRVFGNFDVAEEAVQGAVVAALRTWRRTGVPDKPAAWLHVAARNNGLDLVRRSSRQDRVLRRLPPLPQPDAPVLDQGVVDGGVDDRLPLLFACCHPSLTVESRLALTLRAVIGLTTPQISRAFLVNEATLAQRIVRAKRKIVTAGIALQVPPPEQLQERLDDVLLVVYLMYNEAFVSSSGAGPDNRDLAADAVWLSGVLADMVPTAAEAWGLAALLTFQHARSAARFDPSGSLVLLSDQDRRRWDRNAFETGERLLQRAASLRQPGRYQLQAAIAACHGGAASWEETDWPQILLLYDLAVRLDPSPVTRLNRAIALAKVRGAAEALAVVDELGDRLSGYHLWHATRAQLLRELGRAGEAAQADTLAAAGTVNPAEQRLLQTRLRRYPLSDGS